MSATTTSRTQEIPGFRVQRGMRISQDGRIRDITAVQNLNAVTRRAILDGGKDTVTFLADEPFAVYTGRQYGQYADGITVEIHWDRGDPEVGISAGWDQESTMVSLRQGGVQTLLSFVPEEKPVAEWLVLQVDVVVCEINAHGQIIDFTNIASCEYRDGLPVSSLATLMAAKLVNAKPLTLGSMPQVCAAVEAEWQRLGAGQDQY